MRLTSNEKDARKSVLDGSTKSILRNASYSSSVRKRQTCRQLHKSLTDRPDGGLRSIADGDLAEDVLDVFLDGFDADFEGTPDLLVAQAECHVAQDLSLPLGERDIVVVNDLPNLHGAGNTS